MKRIGVLGGSFDPIHAGHLQLIRDAKKHLKLDRVLIVPSYRNPLKRPPIAHAQHRQAMVRLAIQKIPYASLCLYEMRKKGRSYTVTTLKYLKHRYGKRVEIYFLCGHDLVPELRRWKDFKAILKYCTFAVTKRAGSPLRRIGKDFRVFPMKKVPVSATGLRKALLEGRFPSKALPEEIKRYIKKHHLYGINQT